MEEIIFTVPGKPQGKGRPRAARAGTHVRMYTPAQTVSYENRIMACYLAACHADGRGELRFAHPVELWIEAYFDVPRSYSRAKAEKCRANDPPPRCKPDMDNITKAVADALNGVAYKDDVTITDQHITKRYGSPARLVVRLRGEAEMEKRGDTNADPL